MTQCESQVRVLGIQKFAEICHTTPRTLRFYEQKGLIKPYKIDPMTKYRYYNSLQAREFLKVKLLQNFNIPLKQIANSVTSNTTASVMEQRMATLKEEIDQKKKEYAFLTNIRAFLFEKDLDHVLRTQWFGPYTLFCMKVSHADYNKMDDYFGLIREEAKRLKLHVTDEQLVIYMTTAYEPKDTKVDVALICKQQKPSIQFEKLPENFHFKSFPKTKALVYPYTGPYEYFSLIYQKLFDYIFQKKIALVDHVFDICNTKASEKKSKYDTSAQLVFPIEQSF